MFQLAQLFWKIVHQNMDSLNFAIDKKRRKEWSQWRMKADGPVLLPNLCLFTTVIHFHFFHNVITSYWDTIFSIHFNSSFSFWSYHLLLVRKNLKKSGHWEEGVSSRQAYLHNSVYDNNSFIHLRTIDFSLED